VQKNIPLTKDSDTTYWKYRSKENVDLRSFPVDNAFRIVTNCNTIEIRKSDSTYFGYIKFNVFEIDKVQTGKLFQQIFPLNKETVREMFALIDSTEIGKIPSDLFIKNWKQGFDGINYTVEVKTQNSYSYKSYWTPTIQENVPEAILIQKFIDKFYEMANSKANYNTFKRNIPFLSWTCNGVIVSKVLTKTEYRKYKRKKKLESKNGS
jgi:hypothetical protein